MSGSKKLAYAKHFSEKLFLLCGFRPDEGINCVKGLIFSEECQH